MRRRHMKEVQAASEGLRCVEPRELACACEHLVQVWRHRHQSLCVNVLSELSEDGVALVPRNRATSHQHLERIGNLELVERCEGNLRSASNRGAGCLGETLVHVHRDQRARIDVGRHRSPRPSITISVALGAMTRSPKTDLARASRSGHGVALALGPTGDKRATGRRRRVTSISCPRSTRAMTRLRFCWSSRTDTLLFAMSDILYYKFEPDQGRAISDSRTAPDHHPESFVTQQALKLTVGRSWAIKQALRTLWTYRQGTAVTRFFSQWYGWSRLSLPESPYARTH